MKITTSSEKGDYFRSEHSRMPRGVHILEYKYILKKTNKLQNYIKRETESLLIAAENNAIRTNHIKTRIDKTEQNSKCMLCSDKDETINFMISERSKLA